MVVEPLTPRVQDGQYAHLRAQPLRVLSQPQQGSGRSPEQDLVDDALVLERDGGDLRRHGEHDVEVLDRQDFALAIGKPLRPCCSLALGTMPIAARVVRDRLLATAKTTLDVAAHGGGAAAHKVAQYPALGSGNPAVPGGVEGRAVLADDVSKFELRSCHSPMAFGQAVVVGRSSGLLVP